MLAEWARFLRGRLKVLTEICLGRLGLRKDFVGYEVFLDWIDRNGLWSVRGDLLEIGAFMGGGTAKLAAAAQARGKRVVVIDAFDPTLDTTENDRGESMAWIYTAILGRRSLKKIFDDTIKGYDNIFVYPQDSRTVTLPDDLEFMFSFIDGNHSAEGVKNDFALAWQRTVPGGVVAMHDYGGDLPVVTNAIDETRRRRMNEVERTDILAERTLIFLVKRR